MFRCCLNIAKLNKNAGSLKKPVILIRTYKEIPHKRPTMDELPVPKGSWAANFAKKNAQNNIILLIGAGVFGATLTFMTTSGVINFGRGPGLADISETSSEEQTTETSPAATSEESPVVEKKAKKTSVPKSEEEFDTVEVFVPESEKDSVESKTPSAKKASKDSVAFDDNLDFSDAVESPTESSTVREKHAQSLNYG